MRQIFSVRFFAAVGAVTALLFVLAAVFAGGDETDDADDVGTASDVRVIDLVDQIASSSNPSFAVGLDGTAAGETTLQIDPSRAVTIVAGTPGVDHCGRLDTPEACAIVADLLGEGVVWFALVPFAPSRSVELPAVDTLDDSVATLVNGWQLPHAPVFERRCGDEQFESYRQFKQEFGDDFTTIYDLDQRMLTAVVCRQQVPYA